MMSTATDAKELEDLRQMANIRSAASTICGCRSDLPTTR